MHTPSRSPVRVIGGCVSALLAASAVAATATAAPKPKPTRKPTPKTCSQLTGRTAVRGDVKFGHQGGKVLGCVLPDGPVVQIGNESTGVLREAITFVQTSGPYAIFSDDHSENVDGGGSGSSRFVIDLRSGRKRALSDPCDGTTVIGADGRVAVLSTCDPAFSILEGVPLKGGSIYLDVARDAGGIPPASVTLDGRTVRWTHGDVARTGRI